MSLSGTVYLCTAKKMYSCSPYRVIPIANRKSCTLSNFTHRTKLILSNNIVVKNSTFLTNLRLLEKKGTVSIQSFNEFHKRP